MGNISGARIPIKAKHVGSFWYDTHESELKMLGPGIQLRGAVLPSKPEVLSSIPVTTPPKTAVKQRIASKRELLNIETKVSLWVSWATADLP